MAPDPMVFALANPIPEIMPELARAAPGCPDRHRAFRPPIRSITSSVFLHLSCALDVGATRITEEMKMASVRAIAELAEAEVCDEVAMAYPGEQLAFGRDYLIPKPFDPRLIVKIAPAVAQAAMDSGWPPGLSPISMPTGPSSRNSSITPVPACA